MAKEANVARINWNDEISRILTSRERLNQHFLQEAQQRKDREKQLLERLQIPLILEEVGKQCWGIGKVTFGIGPFETIVGDIDTFFSLRAEWLEYIPAHETTIQVGGLYEAVDETVFVPDAIVKDSKTLLVGARERRDSNWRNGLHQVTINNGTDPDWITSVFTIMDGRKIPEGVEGWVENYEARVRDETECAQRLRETIALLLLEERETKSFPVQQKRRCLPSVLLAIKEGVLLPKELEGCLR